MAPSSANGDIERFKRLINLGRPLRKYIICQLIVGAFVIYIWYQFNGGLVPWFLRRRIPTLTLGPDINTLYYFSQSDDDGSKIKWSHGTNSEVALGKALKSDVEMIEADVMLQGQGTDQQTLVPVMAEQQSSSDSFQLSDWLDMVSRTGNKGIKLDFQSMDAVEISLQKLKEYKIKLRIPVWLHADLVQGPHGETPKVDKTRYFRIMKRLFPECTRSLGWTTGTHTDLSLSGYSWDMVLDMYHLVREWDLEPPIVYTVRATLIRNSVPQLKWLTDNTRGSVLIWKAPEDRILPEDLMYIAYKFAPHNSYFDLNDRDLENFVQTYRHRSKEKLNPLVLQRDTVIFRPEAWVKMGLYIEEHSILPSEEALVLTSRAVYVLTKTKFKVSEFITLHGRIQFLNRKNREAVFGETGLNIYIRPIAYADFESISGIRCFLGVDGFMKVTGSNLNKVKDFTKTQRITPGSHLCYRFSVTDEKSEVVFRVNVVHDCNTLESVKPDETTHAELRVPIPDNVGHEEHPFILKLEDSRRHAIIDELHIKYDTNK